VELGSRRAIFLVSAILVAAMVLGYFALQSAAQFAEMSEQSVLRSTFLLVDEKIDRVEQMIISADEAVFHLVDPLRPETVEIEWQALAPRISPSVRAVVVLDEDDNIRSYHCRCSDEEEAEFLRVFLGGMLPDLMLGEAPIGQLRHLHNTYEGQSYLVAYRTVVIGGERFHLVAHHDTGYLLREVFPRLIGAEDPTRDFGVVGEDGRRIFGSGTPSGGYLVGRSFDTTLYGWRLQLAPEGASVLRARDESFFSAETALVTFALSVLLLGLLFLVYGAVQESRVAALRSEFIANVSHELKTPLSVVRMFSEMLLTDRVRDEKKKRHYLETILRESERLSALIENVLDFSAIERGKEAYQLRDADLGEVVQRAVETVQYRADQAGAEVHLDLPPDLPRVRLDEQAMLLTVLNLLDNALKYGAARDGAARPVGNSKIEIRLERGRRHIYVRVRDHGPGIPEEHLKRVFERFFRVSRSGVEQVRGSGIGLALVKRIVEAHGGRAWAENAEGGGAQVSFSIPISSLTGAEGPVATISARARLMSRPKEEE
jgi:two-component system phosphate regulon sensor histidine kinase PhoR